MSDMPTLEESARTIDECLDFFFFFRFLPTEIVLRLARQLYSGLAAMHAVNMLHRDLHPGNVVVTTDAKGAPLADDDAAVKIIDFGMAKVHDKLQPEHISIQGGAQCYFSPERLRNDPFDDGDDV